MFQAPAPRPLSVATLAAVLLWTAPAANAQLDVTQETKLLPLGTAANDHFATSIAFDGQRAVIGASGVDADAGMAFVYVRTAGGWTLEAALRGNDTVAGDCFGHSVDIDGDRVLVGAPEDFHGGFRSGSIYLFEYTEQDGWQQTLMGTGAIASTDYRYGAAVAIDGDRFAASAPGQTVGGFTGAGVVYMNQKFTFSWGIVDTLTASSPQLDGHFGESLALEGDNLVIGAPDEDVVGPESGSAVLFVHNGTDWERRFQFHALDADSHRAYGASIALEGDTAVIGAPWHPNFDAPLNGSVYVHRFDASSWSQEAKIVSLSDPFDDDRFGRSVALSGDRLAVGSPADFVSTAGNGSAYIYQRTGTSWGIDQKLTPEQDASPAFFGSAVAIAGDTFIGGAPEDDTLLPEGGSARVFVRQGSWTEEATLLRHAGAPDDQFGTSVAVRGNTMAVGAWRSAASGVITCGAVTMYERNGEVWNATQLVLPDDPDVDKWFGYSVALEDDTLAVGAPGDSEAGPLAGAVYVFERQQDGWEQIQKLLPVFANTDAQFGFSLAIWDQRIVVGSPGADTSFASDTGAVYNYTLTLNPEPQWSLQSGGILTAGDGASGDAFGTSVAVHLGSIVIGAPGDDDAGSGSGSVYVRTHPVFGFPFGQSTKLTALDAAAGDGFGHSVALFFETILVGAPQDDDAGLSSGSAYVFTGADTTWTQEAKLATANAGFAHRFGQSVEVVGDTAIVGAHQAVLNGVDAGAAYLFERNGSEWCERVAFQSSDGEHGDRFGWSIDSDGARVVVGARHEQTFGIESGAAYAYKLDLTTYSNFCFGDGGDQMGCTDCPCGNNAPQGSGGGCLNGAGTSAATRASGTPSVTDDTLRFEVCRANPGTFAVLTSGLAAAPANAQNPCFGQNSGVLSVAFDGLRCVVQSTQRHGSRATDANGDAGVTTNGWGAPNGPSGGLLAHGGYSAGQSLYWYVTYREQANLQCMTGQNSTNGVSFTVQP